LNYKKQLFERLRLPLIALQRSFRISENTFLIILAVLIGLLGGLGNYAFRKTIEFVHWGIFEQSEHLFGYSLEEWSLARLAVVFCPVIGGVLVIPLWHWFGKDLKGGFSAFLERVNLRGAKLQLRPIFTRGFGSAITIGTGGSAGQEGPIAMIGGAIGSQFGQLFKMSGDRLKVLVACGAAAGVAATFNAPIAGVFFAQEI
jgi:CIC family chloride channel protein